MKKILTSSLIIFVLFGMIKIFSITPFNRMAGDDYSSAIMGRLGILEDVKATYTGFMGRFSAVLFETPFSVNLAYNGKITLYSLITCGLMLVSIFLFVKNVFKFKTSDVYLYLLTGVFFVLLYQVTPNKQESWYWLTGSIVYLWPIIMFIFSLSLYFVNNNKYLYLPLFLTTFLSAGFNETFSLFTIFISLLLFIYYFKEKERRNLAILMMLSASAAFLIMYLAPGNEARMSSYGASPMSFLGSILYSLSEGPKYFISILTSNLTIMLSSFLFLTLLMLYIYPFSKKENFNVDILITNIFKAFLISFVLSVIYMVPSFIGLGRVQPDRSALSLSFILVLALFYIAYNFAKILNSFKLKDIISTKFGVLIISLFILFSSYIFLESLPQDFYITKNYANHFDQMINKFKELSKFGNMENVEVSLPESGLVAEMIDPPGIYSYKNLSLSQYYNIGKVISVKHDEKK